MSDLPRPLPPVPGDLDLRDFPKMFIDTGVVLGSALADAAKVSPDAFRAAMLLRFISWQQVPAASLPSDERRLAALIGVSHQKWKIVREEALQGFVLCADGRFYHTDVVEEALNATAYRKKQSARAHKRWNPQAALDLGDNLGRTGGKLDAMAFPQRSGSSSPSPSDGEGFTLPAWVPMEAWAAFVAMRVHIKAPMTALAMKLVVSELAAISGPTGADASAILLRSARNNWKDVYQLKDRGQGPGTPGGGDLQSRNSARVAAFASGGSKP